MKKASRSGALILIGALLLAVASSVNGARILTQDVTPINSVDTHKTTTAVEIPNTLDSDNALSVTFTADSAAATNDDYPLCQTCVEFANKAINYLLNAILNEGVMATCGQLCAYVPGAVEEQVCTMVCEMAGVAGFIKAVNSADLDSINLCEMLDESGVNVCPVKHCPTTDPDCLTLGALAVKPKHADAGAASFRA